MEELEGLLAVVELEAYQTLLAMGETVTVLTEYDEDEDGSHAPHVAVLEVEGDELEEVGSHSDHGSLDDELDDEELVVVLDQTAHGSGVVALDELVEADDQSAHVGYPLPVASPVNAHLVFGLHLPKLAYFDGIEEVADDDEL